MFGSKKEKKIRSGRANKLYSLKGLGNFRTGTGQPIPKKYSVIDRGIKGEKQNESRKQKEHIDP